MPAECVRPSWSGEGPGHMWPGTTWHDPAIIHSESVSRLVAGTMPGHDGQADAGDRDFCSSH